MFFAPCNRSGFRPLPWHKRADNWCFMIARQIDRAIFMTFRVPLPGRHANNISAVLVFVRFQRAAYITLTVKSFSRFDGVADCICRSSVCIQRI